MKSNGLVSFHDLQSFSAVCGVLEELDLSIVSFLRDHKVPAPLRRDLERLVYLGAIRTLGDLGRPKVQPTIAKVVRGRRRPAMLRLLREHLLSQSKQKMLSEGGELRPGVKSSFIRRWIVAHQVEFWGELSISFFADDVRGFWADEELTVTQMLCADSGGGPQGYYLTSAIFIYLRNKAFRVINDAAEAVRLGLLREKERLSARVPPESPALKECWDQAQRLRRKLRLQIPPVYIEQDGFPGPVSLRREGPGLVWTIHPSLSCFGLDSDAVVNLLRDEEGNWALRGNSDEVSERCPMGTLTALDGFLDVLGLPEQATLRRALEEQLARGAWEWAVDELMGEMDLALEGPLVLDGVPADFVWGLSLNNSHLAVHINPALARPRKRGSGVVLRKITLSRALELGDVLSNEADREILELLEFHRMLERNSHTSYQAMKLMARALRLLAGHPRVHLIGQGNPRVSVERILVAAHAQKVRRGGARFVLRAGEEELNPLEMLGDRLYYTGGLLPRWDAASSRLRLLEVSASVRRLADQLYHSPIELPNEAVPRLVERVAPLVQTGRVVLDPKMLGRKIKSSLRVGVELAVMDSRLRVSLYLLPSPEGLSVVPGQGQERWIALREGRVIHALRDLSAEREVAKALWKKLELPEATGPFTVALSNTDDALALVERLSGLQREVDTRWDGGRMRSLGEVGADHLSVSVGSGRDWFELSGELKVEGVAVPLSDLLSAIRDRQRYLKVEGRGWVKLNTRLRQGLRAWADAGDRPQVGVLEAPALLELQDEGAQIEGPARWLKIADRVREAAAMSPALPPSLLGTLRSYQREGFEWLVRLSHWAPGAVLADDMGLGKTVQALALLLHRVSLGPALVIAPTSVTFNWLREVERFAPSLRFRQIRSKRDVGLLQDLKTGDVVLLSWQMAVRQIELLVERRWATLVMDEAHAIKNAATRRARAIVKLQAEFNLALTGTPLENRTGELWSLMRVVVPGLFGGKRRFAERFVVPIERYKDQAAAQALAALIAPFMLRRLKSQVAQELPPRTEIRVDIELSIAERRQYDQLRHSLLAATRAKKSEAEEQGLRFMILAALTRLRQMACHPALIDPESKLPSAKLEILRHLISELREGGHRALIFSQFTRLLALVRAALESDGVRCLQLDGGVAAQKRQTLVASFQRGEADVFLLSIKAGGVGLNLTAASYVFHLDPWWNPAVEDQATDRVHRIGQDKAVTVYRMVSRNTVEEAIYDMHRDKRELVDSVLAGTGKASAMSLDQLCDLVELSGAASSSVSSATTKVSGRSIAIGSRRAGRGGAVVLTVEPGSAEAGSAEAGSAEAGSAEAGSAEAGSAELGSAESGEL